MSLLLLFFLLPIFSPLLSGGVETNLTNTESDLVYTSEHYRSDSPLNETFARSVLSFVERSQDDGTKRIPSMDMAYYLGMALHYLDYFSFEIPTSLQDQCLEFIQSARNENGGYANWKGAKSSMESTYQAVVLLQAYGYQDALSSNEANITIEFIQGLKTIEQGYLPIPQWDAPDVSSTYRSIRTKDVLHTEYQEIQNPPDNSSIVFLDDAYVPPIFSLGASGYSENIGGIPELLASLYALEAYILLNSTSSAKLEPVAKFLDSLIATNGGVSGYIGGYPTTGYTASAIELYLLLRYDTALDLDSYITSSFIEDATNYLLANLISGSGFAASDRDATAEFSSTMFALRALMLMDEKGLLGSIPDLTGVYDFLVNGIQPTYGFGEYPGDNPDLSLSTYAILLGKILGNTSLIDSGVKQYIDESYSESRGGFGFRPSSTARVKYTYYGIKAARAFSQPLSNAQEIAQFLLDSQNVEGGFGEQPASSLSYLTHTYWATFGLYDLGEMDNDILDIGKLLNWLFYLRKPDGSYSNFPGQNATLRSTYRALQLLQLLNQSISENDSLSTSLSNYQTPSGGYVNSLDTSVPTMESTFYGIALTLILKQDLNRTKVEEFILSLYNQDGGFGLRPGFSSRMTSTFYALLALQLLHKDEMSLTKLDFTESPDDFFSPIIIPAFIPQIDNNKTFQGSYLLSAVIQDPESATDRAWVEALWTGIDSNQTQEFNIDGEKSQVYSNEWLFLLGFFPESGVLQFRVHASDMNNDSAQSEWYILRSLSSVTGVSSSSFNFVDAVLPFITPFLFGLAAVEGIISFNQKRKEKERDVLMSLITKKEGLLNNDALSTIGILIVMGTISLLGRLFIQDAIIILQNSIFLFRFLIGMFVVLIVKYVFGLKTFGLFGPTVIVISMLTLGPLWGLAVFLNVFTVGYVLRSLIDQFNLAVGFRIGFLMVFTISFIGLLELIGEVFLIPVLSGSILLPIIITPWYIDRFVTEKEQSDQLSALTRFATTITVTLIAYFFMSIDTLVEFIVVNPELWLLMAGAVLYFGRSAKYSRLDKQRFSRLFSKREDPLSIQIRNRDYIARYNSRMLFPIINKYNMKEQFEKWNVPTAELLAIVNSEEQLSELMKRLSSEDAFKDGFVIKPAQSFGGKGITVVSERTNDGNYIIGESTYAPIAIENEIRKIIQGDYLTSQTLNDRDIVIIEEKITNHPDLQKISVGLPDVRVIVFRGIPVMAMMRLSTKESHGKANLKQGAIGAAVRLSDGIVFRAEMKGIPIERHPDTGEKIKGFKLENWTQILATACLAQKSSGLGYAGVDIVIDKNNRILLLEINKRPGLEIQNINQSSLLTRFDFIEKENLDATLQSPISSAQLGMKLARSNWEMEGDIK